MNALGLFLLALGLLFPFVARGDCRVEIAEVVLTDVQREQVSGLTFVLVDGFMNEHHQGRYFRSNLAELAALGVPEEHVHHLAPPSAVSFERNVDALELRIAPIALRNPERRIVLVGHSRGAAMLLALALRSPLFVERHVQGILLVQASVGGSAVSEFLLTGRIPGGEHVPWHVRLRLQALRWAMRRYRPMPEATLAEVAPATSRRFWERLRVEHADAIPRITSRVHWVVGSEDPARMARYHRLTGYWLQRAFGYNDGRVLVDDQSLPWVGSIAMHVRADHRAFFIGAAATEAFRANATRLLVRTVLP